MVRRDLTASLPLLTALLLCSGAWAQTAATDAAPEVNLVAVDSALTLHDVVQQAMTLDPRRTLPGAYDAEARALRQRADALFAGSPALAVRHQTDQTGSNKGLREWEANLELPLWRWGQQDASEAVAQHARALADASGTALELQVAGTIREALWFLLEAEDRAALAEQAWQTAQALQQEVAIRVKAGDLAKSDLLLAQDETLSKQDEYILARTELLHAGKRYMALTGLDRRPAEFSELQSGKSAIEANHPLLLEASNRLQRSQAELQQVERAGNASPQLTVGTRRERDIVTGLDMDSVGVGIRLPIGGKSYAAPALAAASRGVAENFSNLERTQRELRLALHEAEHAVETLRTELALSAQQRLLNRENLRMAHIAFTVGEMDLAQLLRIQSRAFAADRNFSLRKLQLQQAIARYNQAVGELP